MNNDGLWTLKHVRFAVGKAKIAWHACIDWVAFEMLFSKNVVLWQGKLGNGYKLARIWSSIKHTFVFAYKVAATISRK
ncbi:hypothetical protein T4D_16565 [Trichinella pseudospiralis]|uniref:Uncharacterized protein n=1 Tax=Trichinella pseudospiralis TaxID=6337 RepID=A0A0V1FZC9_TRIPS|nr:hypothetical protein T4D_16565 [Trichinella pseudospiralis]